MLGEIRLSIVVVTGMSGSGKSVVLHALEDAGYFCIDNLPLPLLSALLDLEMGRGTRQLAIAVDARNPDGLSTFPLTLASLLQRKDLHIKTLFLDAANEVLVRRFSETRRAHPLTLGMKTTCPEMPHGLLEAIAMEREWLADIREHAHVIDTSFLLPSKLQAFVKAFLDMPASPMTLVVESFAYKRGLPVDADFVMDVRMLPNPYYINELRMLTGLDAAVIQYLEQQPEVLAMLNHIEQFLRSWLPTMRRNHRSYITVAIGCTGGQHRSVYLAQRLGGAFLSNNRAVELAVLTRHRELASV